MISMGIDASTTSTGWSIFENDKLIGYGVIQPKGENWRERLFHEGPQLVTIIKKYIPEKIYMEDVPLKEGNKQTLVILGAVQGFLYGIASSLHVPIEFVYPSTWRSQIGLFNGTEQGKKRQILKKRAIELANKLFDLDLIYKSPSSKFNQDDIAESILICYSQVKPRKFGKKI